MSRATRAVTAMLATSFAFVSFVLVQPSGASTQSTTVTLVSQTDWARGPAPMAFRLDVNSSLPRSDLGLKVTLYSRLTSRYEFGISETGNEPPSELVLGSSPIIPVTSLNRALARPNTVAISVRFVTAATPKPGPISSPELALDCSPGACDGVYPLEVVVVDRSTDKPLASLTTQLIYLAGSPGLYRLKVALLWSLGSEPALSPAGKSTLSPVRLAELTTTLRSFGSHRQVPVTIDAYPQMLLALSRTAGATALADLASLRSLALRAQTSRSVEWVGAPFTSVSATALANVGLAGDFTSQLATGRSTYHALFGVAPIENPYVSPVRLNGAALSLLSREHLDEVVIPQSNVHTSTTTTPIAPFNLEPTHTSSTSQSSSGVQAFVADAGLASHFGPSSDPVLAAHNFLADVAQIFFEAPFAAAARGVVVEPPSLPANAPFLSIVLNGLESSPITKASTLSALFSSVRVGANASADDEPLVDPHGNSASYSAKSIGKSRAALGTLESVVPKDNAYTATARESILLAETSGLSSSQSAHFASGPAFALDFVKRSLTLSGTRTVTITQHRARVPVTLISTFPSPVHAKLHLESGALAIAPGIAHSIVLAHKNTALSVSVDARTSGVSTLAVELVSPRGGIVLLKADFTVRSTAFSIVAVVISAAALAVLGAWWLRTMMRRRRRRAAARRAVVETAPEA